MRKPAFCICENKGADQLCSNCTADQCLCFRYIVKSRFYLNINFQASCHLLWLYSLVHVGPGQIPKDRFSCNDAQLKIVAQLDVNFPDV